MKNYKLLIIGLGSIGKNLALSLIEKGYKINAWDKEQSKNKIFCKYLKIKPIENVFKFIHMFYNLIHSNEMKEVIIFIKFIIIYNSNS